MCLKIDKIVTQKKNQNKKNTGAANPKVRAGKHKLKQETPAKLKIYKENKDEAALQLYK